MAHVSYVKPIEELHGKLNTPKAKDGTMYVLRRKCLGVTKSGKKLFGPLESYTMQRHQGSWSAGAVENRKGFADLMKRAHAELRDPQRKAYWQEQLEEHWEHHEPGEKVYTKLSAFVASRLRAGQE